MLATMLIATHRAQVIERGDFFASTLLLMIDSIIPVTRYVEWHRLANLPAAHHPVRWWPRV
jgi:hypothetical protein